MIHKNCVAYPLLDFIFNLQTQEIDANTVKISQYFPKNTKNFHDRFKTEFIKMVQWL
jgi:hypothetical protein